MKKTLSAIALVLVFTSAASAQALKRFDFPEYQFQTVQENAITPVKNQASSGTCWAFSTIGFVESEIIRINNIKDTAKYPDLSEFFIVNHSYVDRAEKFVRLDGKLNFGAGSEADDVLDVIRDYGIVPQSAYSGMNYGSELPKQAEMDAVLAAYVEAVAKNPNRTLTTAWKRGFQAVVNEYLGQIPETFTVNGKEFTPQTYRESLKFNPDDYICLTSFTHHPFYTWFAIEVSDNWRWDRSYNVPIDEFMSILDNAINNGFTAAWGTDVSDAGFTRDGLAILVDVKKSTKEAPKAGSDQEHWVGKEEGKPAPEAQNEVVEREASQEQRQLDFDNKTITDDHGMQIYGIAKDKNGAKYYMVKNSWGQTGKYKGIWYASEAFVKGQSMDILIHKDALPKEFKAKHNL